MMPRRYNDFEFRARKRIISATKCRRGFGFSRESPVKAPFRELFIGHGMPQNRLVKRFAVRQGRLPSCAKIGIDRFNIV